MKIVLSVVGVLVALLVIGFFAVAFSLGSIVKAGVNKKGPELTQSKVELAAARISPFSGQGTLSNLVVGNPAGWQSQNAFSLGEISINVEPRSLMGDHVVVNSILIDRPEITYETKVTSSNLQDLLKNVQQAAGAGREPSTAKNGKPIKIEVKHFQLQNAKITAIAGAATASIDMPALVLDDLGTKEGGLTPEQLSAAIVKAVTAQAVQAGARIAIEKGVLEKAGAGLEKLLGGGKSNKTPAATP